MTRMNPFRLPRPTRIRGLNAVCAALVLIALLGCTPDPPPGRSDSPESRISADPPPTNVTYDWLIHGGTLVDGTGAPGYPADLLVREGRIAHIGPLDPAEYEIRARFDASGLVVAPGFIDAHAHGDPLETPEFSNALAQGVTTVVLGQDGSSPRAGEMAAHLDAVEAAGPSVNVAYLVGHNTIRPESGVGFDQADAAGRARMAELVAQAMDAGALGLSTGLEYDPGTQSDLEELAEIARPVADRGGVVTSHMRNEDEDAVATSVAELLEQGRRSGAHVHATHLKVVLGNDPAKAEEILDMMAAARAEGLRVTGDVYPYTASFTGLSILFPDWARPPNDYDTAVRERRPELAAHLRARVEARNGPAATLFGSGDWTGRTLEEVAAEEGKPFEDILIDLGPRGARAAYFVMNEEVMTTFLRDPQIAVSSDGSPEMAHPRGYGSFARVIRQHVVESGDLTLEEAVRKMTGFTASIFGLDDPERTEIPRGLLQEGWAADVVAFDPSDVADVARYDEPHLLAEGFQRVWVNGREAWRDGARSGESPAGRVLRRR